MRLNKEIISAILFIASFLVYILSSYGVGKAESDNDKPLKDFAIAGLVISMVSMATIWVFNWGIQTPDYSEELLLSWSSKFK